MNAWKRMTACLTAALLAVTLLCPMTASAATEGYDDNGCLIFATEPGQTSTYAYYYKDGKQQSTDLMTWVDGGVHGKALKLDGMTEYLELDFYQTPKTAFTFATWINFSGALDPANPASAYWQRLFTLNSPAERYFTVSPHAADATITNDEGALNGVYMEYYPGHAEGGERGETFRMFDGVQDGMSQFGLPQNEWHHVALVSDTRTITLYIDGAPALKEDYAMVPSQMNINATMIGKGIWNDATLNALLDDTMIFEKALNELQLEALMQTGDPTVAGAAAPIVTTTTGYQPTAPVTTVPTQDMQARNDDQPLTVFGLEMPLWGVAITFGLLGLFIVLIVTVSLYERYWRKKNNKPLKSKKKAADAPEEPKAPKKTKAKKEKTKKTDETDDEQPAMSIKEAALQKRREEHERFLAEEDASDEQD
ncbi:MAG: hypothetical protein IJB27_04560 [Clostridia bacterium]|nr:hypothetical protein [Clostridia bacterium]